ncbi:MAG: hypothetical protein M1823_008071 [Watsoniomyces obsoletus]|nr:MAG: hypothetical protein M1823_008071 [Watsoniomyces obsoletus]
MFASSETTEKPEWTRLRYEALSEFRIPPVYGSSPPPTLDPAPYKQRIERLKHKYPYKDVESNLLKCLEHFWILNCSENVSGKPVLVQIEEGRLAGFTNAEFEEFLVRVGVKRDDKGILKLDLT